MATFKFRKVDEITVNAPDLEQAEAELSRQGLVGFSLVKEAKAVEPKAEPTVPVTVKLICDSMTVEGMKVLLEDHGFKTSWNSREKTLAKKILDAGLFKA